MWHETGHDLSGDQLALDSMSESHSEIIDGPYDIVEHLRILN
jgi:hypothetical protein